MTAKEVAAVSGVSVRTLHHYDGIGLLRPARREDNGYRQYTDADLGRLQQILFFRACGFSLDAIRRLLDSPSFDRMAACELQRKALLHERARIDATLETLENTMRAMRGEITMSKKEQFDGLDFSRNPYEQEARERWGDAAVDKSNARLNKLGERGRKELGEVFGELFARLAALRGEAPASETAQAAIGEMFRVFNANFGTYTPEAFGNLGRMYVDDERFTRNIDQFGEGLAAFLAEAMGIYAERRANEQED